MTRRLVSFSAFCLLFAACDRKPADTASRTPAPEPVSTPLEEATPRPKIPAQPTPEPKPTPEPTPYVPNKQLQTGTIFNGITYKTNFETLHGTTATADRNSPDSYTVEVNVKVKVPKPHQSLEELKKLNPRLDVILPALPEMLETAKVSPEFDILYRTKVNQMRTNLNRLDALLSRHNFYDCETVLQLENPKTKRRAILVQADMDVDTDGSDGDRVYAADGSQSRTYQPFTSYRWPKRTKIPNPCVPHWEKRIAGNEEKLRDAKTSAAEAAKLKADNSRLRAEIKEMGTFSYLVGGADPFIVLPTPMFGRGKTGYTPAMGDYCAVIVGDTIYPAIVGDAGPTAKTGEASLRLCQQVSERAGPAYRAISDLKATYVVFVGTTERPWGPPDLEKWRTRCEELLNEFGGYTGELFKWEDITRSAEPPPPPAVLPTTPPTVVPTPTPAPGAPSAPITSPASPASPPAEPSSEAAAGA